MTTLGRGSVVLLVGLILLAIAGYVAFAKGLLDLWTLVVLWLVEVSAGLVVSYFTKKPNAERSKGVEFELTVLPDYAGQLVGPSPPKVVENPDGTKSASFVNDIRATTPEFGRLARSQQWWVGHGPVDQPLKVVFAKFGVIRVRAVGGAALRCHAELKYRAARPPNIEPSGPWIPLGDLNWWSPEKKLESQGHAEEIRNSAGSLMNKFLRNPIIDIYENEERDLLVTFMFMDQPSVFLCVDSGPGMIGYASGGNPVVFEVEIGFAAENVARRPFRFLVTTRWDYCKIEKID